MGLKELRNYPKPKNESTKNKILDKQVLIFKTPFGEMPKDLHRVIRKNIVHNIHDFLDFDTSQSSFKVKAVSFFANLTPEGTFARILPYLHEKILPKEILDIMINAMVIYFNQIIELESQGLLSNLGTGISRQMRNIVKDHT